MKITKLFTSAKLFERNVIYFGNAKNYCCAPTKTKSEPVKEVSASKKGLVVGVYQNKNKFELTPIGEEINQKCGDKITQHLNNISGELQLGKAFSLTDVLPEYSAIAITSFGPKDACYNSLETLDESRENIRWGVGAGVKLLKYRGCGVIEVDPAHAPDAAAEAAELAAWKFDRFKTTGSRKAACQVKLYGNEGKELWTLGSIQGKAQNWARYLSDMPANKMTPVDLAQAAIDVLCPLGVTVEAHDREWIEAQRMRAFLAVAQGSCDTPMFLECTYRAAASDAPTAAPVLLAAKGVTFDSGGLCLKDCEMMMHNRGSMAGAAVVLAAMKVIAKLKVFVYRNEFCKFISRFLIGRSTVAEIIKETCEVIWKVLQPLEMPEPNKESFLKVAEEFYKYANFPNCLGAVDGKHIRIINPDYSGSNFFNYKKFFSIVLMAAADSNYCFIIIDVGSFGKEADSNVFRSSNFGQKLYHDMLDLPEDKILPGTTGPALPYVLVADEAFALHKHVMRPYPNKTLDIEKRTFNYRLSRARRYVECTFGILSNKWRVLHTAILVNPDFATEIVKTTCVLHNFVRRRDGLNCNDELLTSDLPTLPNCNTSRPSNAINTRDLFKNILWKKIENTDMEGRLMMADALVYGQSVYKPAIVIDVATFTHGVLMATGGGAFGCFSNSEEAWRAVQAAGADTGDRAWRFPLWNYFHKQITNEPSVDLRNKGSGCGTPCLGAAFLKNFICCDWVHMDITGVGKVAQWGAPPYLAPRRMTGRPTRTLAALLRRMAADNHHDHHKDHKDHKEHKGATKA
ncbi:hypothetical protein HF086_005452 [Spodoptera exigua]|uniref:Cytosol aminopeptidase n=1 Tax=Spodoptera exigua TaxID=7107 RepID=A0A922MC12_SPOEX|nr:hypothetical protein HF086_005452 [Spodoptera exigua]